MKLRRVKAISYKEFIHLFRDFRSLLVVILVPVILLILFGYALKLDVENVPIAIIDNDRTPQSREYIDMLRVTDSFDARFFPDTYKEAERLLDTGHVQTILVIPKGFASELANGDTAKVQVILDGSEITTASSIINYVSGITALYNSIHIEALQRVSGQTMPFGVAVSELRFWFNEDMRSVNYLFPGLVAIIMSVVAGFLTSLTIAREWEMGTMEQLIPTPLTEGEVIAGKLFTYFVIGFIDVVIYIFMGEFIFGVVMKGSAVLTFSFAVLFLLCMLSFGIFVSIVMKGQLAASQVTTLATMLPAFLLSGFVFDIGNMPTVIQWVTYVFPARYFVDILRGIYLKGVGAEYLLQNGAFLVVYAVVMLLLCRAKLKMRA